MRKNTALEQSARFRACSEHALADPVENHRWSADYLKQKATIDFLPESQAFPTTEIKAIVRKLINWSFRSKGGERIVPQDERYNNSLRKGIWTD